MALISMTAALILNANLAVAGMALSGIAMGAAALGQRLRWRLRSRRKASTCWSS